jgi:acyl-CoA thioester hydrolase
LLNSGCIKYLALGQLRPLHRRIFQDNDRYMSSLSHMFPIRILPDDIDFMGHVNNSRYLNWVQEAVLSHWRNIAPAEAVAAHLWVALKHEITYRKPAFLEDDVVANVVLEKVQGARAFYATIIQRGEEVIAEVKSSWCCIDAQTLRPARLASDVIGQFFGKSGDQTA